MNAKHLLLGAALAVLAGCVTETPSPPTSQPNMAQAAGLNVQLGFEYFRKGLRADAVTKFELALREDPKNANARYGLAMVNTQVGDFKTARRWFEEAVSYSNGDPSIRNAYGLFLCDRGEYAAAEKALLEAAQNLNYQTPEYALANAGICAHRAKDLVNSEAHLRAALAVNPTFAPALLELADISLERGEALKSRAFLERLSEVSRADPRTLLLNWRTERALGDERSAQRSASQLLRDFPNSAEAREVAKK